MALASDGVSRNFMALIASDFSDIQHLVVFASVPKKTLTGLLKRARIHEFAAGSVLFKQGETADYLYIAIDGHVALRAKNERGHDTVIEFVPAGEPFIVAAALLRRPLLLSAQILTTSRVVLIPATDFRHGVETDLALAVAFNRAAAEHWRILIGQLKSLKMRTGTQRLAAFLLSLAERRAGEGTINLPCERRVLATWLGMVPTSASRAFRELASIGVEGRGRSLRVKSFQRLAEFAEQQL